MTDLHIPVMRDEMLANLAPKDGETYIDGTFGAGGYTRAILNEADCFVYGVDRDPNVSATAEKMREEFPENFFFIEGTFSNVLELLEKEEYPAVNGIVLDIGVSSMQLDQAERGFSFSKTAPLDMRMGKNGITAGELINTMKEEDLANVIYQYGDERQSRRIAKAIVESRKEGEIKTTTELTKIIHKSIGNRGKTDSATRTFQAIRIYINDELNELKKALTIAERLLAPNGRLVIVSFHSLEDRIVKSFLRDRTGGVASASRHIPQVCNENKPITFNYIQKKALKPSSVEVGQNPRSRSAVLRGAIRTEVSL